MEREFHTLLCKYSYRHVERECPTNNVRVLTLLVDFICALDIGCETISGSIPPSVQYCCDSFTCLSTACHTRPTPSLSQSEEERAAAELGDELYAQVGLSLVCRCTVVYRFFCVDISSLFASSHLLFR